MRKQHIRHSMSSFKQILIKYFIRLFLGCSVIFLCACSNISQNDIHYSFHSDNDMTYLDIRLDRRVLSRYNDERLLHFLTESSSFGSNVSLTYNGQNEVFRRACRYDRWNERFLIQDYFSGGSVRSFRQFDEFISQMLVFENIPISNIIPEIGHGGRIGMVYTVSLMTFPPPINLLMLDRYRIRVYSTIVLNN